MITFNTTRKCDTPDTTLDELIKNFPFPALRERQSYVLNEIGTAFDSGYKIILLEAPTGFGKSPVAIAVALRLGSSYICTSTKDLQTQVLKGLPLSKGSKRKEQFSISSKGRFYQKRNLQMWIVRFNSRLWAMYE